MVLNMGRNTTERPRYSVDRPEPGHGNRVRSQESESKERNVFLKVSETYNTIPGLKTEGEDDMWRPEGRDE